MDFRTASKTALLVLPPSHTAGIVPFATAPQIVIVYYLAGGAASDSRMAAENAGIWLTATNAVIRPVANFSWHVLGHSPEKIPLCPDKKVHESAGRRK
jgi:hypothetical protein